MCQLSDRFFSAIRTLSAEGPIKQRLTTAYTENLSMLPDDDIPESIKAKFEALRNAMHAAKPLPGEDAVVASVRKMSVHEAGRHAAGIVSMFSELVRVKSTGERLTARKRPQVDKKATEQKTVRIPEAIRSTLN